MTFLHPDPIREIAAPHEFIRIEGAQIRLKGARFAEAERIERFKAAAKLRLWEGLLLGSIIILAIYAGASQWAALASAAAV